jgi:hypothetical protein
VARNHALDGRVVAPLGIGRALLVYDPSVAVDWRRPVLKKGEDEPRKEQEGSEAYVVRQLASLLSVRFELRLGVLGRVRTWTLDEPLSRSLQGSARFPLLLPVLEETAAWDLDLAVVISRGPIIDVQDLEDYPAADRLIRISLTEPEPEEVAPPDWCLVGHPTDQRLDELETVIEDRWLTAQREAPPGAWKGLTERFGVGSHLSAEEREAVLLQACQALGDPIEASGPADLVRSLSAAFMEWAAEDLPTALEVLARWLDPDQTATAGAEPAQDQKSPSGAEEFLVPSDASRVAAAAAKALYRLHEEANLEPDNETALLFDRLAWPLSSADPDGVRTVLRTVRAWLTDPGWSRHLASVDPEGGDGRGRLLQWAERFIPGRSKELAELLPQITNDELEGDLLSDLLQAIAGGPTYRPWPVLASGQRRGLVITDSLSPSGAGGLATRLASRVHQDSPETIPTIVRLGEVRPIWVPGARAWGEIEESSPPRLLVPLLECEEVDPAFVEFVLILTSGPILDAADLLRSAWWSKIYVLPLGAASVLPQGLRWLIPKSTVERSRQLTEAQIFEILKDALVRDKAAAAGPSWTEH